MLEEVALERQFGKEVARFFHGVLEDHGVELLRRRRARPLRGRRRTRDEGGHELRARAGLRLRRRRGGGHARRDARALRRARAGRHAAASAARPGLESSVPGHLRGRRQLRVREPRSTARRLRLEHWDVAANQGKTAALNMLGRGVEHDVVPYFFSDLADWASLEYVGPGEGEPVVRGSLDDGEFSVFWRRRRTGHGRAVGRALGRPRARAPLHRGRCSRAIRRRWPTSAPTSTRSSRPPPRRRGSGW